MSTRISVTRLLTGTALALAMVAGPVVSVDAAIDNKLNVHTSSSFDDVPPNTVVVDEGGFDRIEVIPNGATEPAADGRPLPAAAWARGGSCTAPTGRQVTCKDSTGYIVKQGSTSKMKLGYSWSVAWFSSSNANVIGRGFINGEETWRGGGNAKSGKFSVPWYAGKGFSIMAVKKIKVRSMNPPAGVVVNWS